MPESRYDVIELKAEVSPEGWIRDKPVVTRAGIFKYHTPDGRVKREYRPEVEVFSTDSLSSLAGVPVTDGHRGLINRGNTSGIIGTVLSPGLKVEGDVVAEVVIHDSDRLGKRRELSLGYTCDVDDTPGVWNGEPYDSIQKNIKYNHLAVVTKGRAGNAKLRLDHDDAASFPFESSENTQMDTRMLILRLDEIDYQAAPEVVNAYRKAVSDLAASSSRFDSLEAERDSLKTKLAEAVAATDEVRANARNEVKARLELEKVADQHKVKFDAADDDLAVKVKILTKLRPSIKFDGRSEEYVKCAFDLAMADETERSRKVSGQFSKFDAVSSTPDGGAAASARDNMIRRIRGEKAENAA
jgi:hypothetical protein